MKKALIFVAMLAFALSSCATGNDNKSANGEKSTVKVRISMPSLGNGTRAQGGKVAHGTVANFSNGLLVFADKDDKSVYSVEIRGVGAFDSATNTVGLDVLKSGAAINGVPEAAVKVYFIGNPPSSFNPATTNVPNMITTLEHQYSAGSVTNVLLFNTPESGTLTSTGTNTYSAHLTVRPVATRFEIDQIVDTTEANEPYLVEGIFFGRFYEEMYLSGVAVAGNATDYYLVDPVGGFVGDNSATYRTGLKGRVYDYIDVLNAQKSLQLTGSNTWAYNLLAPTDGLFPYLVIRVRKNDDAATPRYLTIANFYRDAEKKNRIEYLEPGKVFVIKKIEFSSEINYPKVDGQFTVEYYSDGKGEGASTTGTFPESGGYWIDADKDGKPDTQVAPGNPVEEEIQTPVWVDANGNGTLDELTPSGSGLYEGYVPVPDDKDPLDPKPEDPNKTLHSVDVIVEVLTWQVEEITPEILP